MFQNTIQIAKTNYYFNDFKWRRMALSCGKKLSALLRTITSKHHWWLLLFELSSFF